VQRVFFHTHNATGATVASSLISIVFDQWLNPLRSHAAFRLRCREEHIGKKIEQSIAEAKAKLASGDKKGSFCF
jgi:hypothetical protein